MVSFDLKDIQGNILRSYNFPAAVFLLFAIPEADAGRGFLGATVDEVTNAEEWTTPPATTTNVALSYEGLRALDVEDAVLCKLPGAFREPMRDRAPRVLDDTGESAPAKWDEGLGTEKSHVLVMVGASAGNEGPPLTAAVGAVRRRAADHGLAEAHSQEVASLPNRREHFGWADGFGQPAVEGVPRSMPGQGVPQDDGVTWRDLKAGEFVMGYPDEDGQVVSGSAARLLRNGSYMVYRKLRQDVVAFRKALYAEAGRYGETVRPDPSLDPDQLYELMAAKVVGRWRDGKAIELVDRRSEEESRALGDRTLADPDNDFRYYQGDADGFRCPKGAHIRRTNPRDALGWGGKMSTRHRILRRGMPYGTYLAGLEDDRQERGLLFICFQADIERQFEVIQAQWCNDGNAFALGNDKDYLLGDDQGTGKVTIQGTPPHFARAQPFVVLTRGCEYLLMPGIDALRDIAER